MKRDGLDVQTKTARFAETVVSLDQKTAVGQPAPAYRPGKEGYADWVILAVQGLKKYLGIRTENCWMSCEKCRG